MHNRIGRRPGASGGGFQAVPRGSAVAALVSEAQSEQTQRDSRQNSSTQGQQAGVAGMGPAPELFHQPGGNILLNLQHPAFTTVEKLFRAQPEEGWFDPDLSPESPVFFQLGAYKVPKGMTLWLFDYEGTVYRPSGVDPGDFIEAERGRFSNQLGFDLTIEGNRQGDISYQLIPQPVQVGNMSFDPPIGDPRQPANVFNRASSGSFASTAGVGTSLMPPRRAVQGAEGMPFTFIVGQGASVEITCVIFNTVRSPLAAIQGRLAGYTINNQFSSALLNRMRPR